MPGSDRPERNAKTSDAGPEASRGSNAGSRPEFEPAQTDNAPGHEQRSFQYPTGTGAQERYDPSAVDATRERSKGLGMGERDLERQRDPHRPAAPPDRQGLPDGEH